MLKGNRYTVSERMGEYPPMDTPKPFKMPKELKEEQKKALVDMMADDAKDGLYETNTNQDEQEETDRGDDQKVEEPEAPVRGDL